MMHNHEHAHSSQRRNITVAFWLNLCFTIAEAVGGVMTNSMAILSDALHDFGDSLSLGLAWYFSKLSEKETTLTFSYGFKRFSLLAALINGIVLIAGSLIILAKAIPRIIHPEHSNARGMLVFALFGIAINGLAALKMQKGRTMNERVVTWHLLEDVLGWVAVLVVSIAMLFKDIHVLDPALCIIITLYILWNVVKNLRKTAMLFMQGVPEDMSIEMVEGLIRGSIGVKDIHDTHIWSLDGQSHILTTHLIVDKTFSREQIVDIKCRTKRLLEKSGIEHATIEVEIEGEKCEI